MEPFFSLEGAINVILVNKKHDTDPLTAIFRGNDGQVQGLLYPLARTRHAEGMNVGTGRNCCGCFERITGPVPGTSTGWLLGGQLKPL